MSDVATDVEHCYLTPEQEIGIEESAFTLAEHHGWDAARWFIRAVRNHARGCRGISEENIDGYFETAIENTKT
jgi:hypothetical protein